MNKKPSTYHFIITPRAFIPGVLFLMVWLASCKNDPKEIDALTNKTQMREDKAKDVVIIRSVRGKIQIRLFAHEFIRNEFANPPYTELKNGVRAEIYDDSGRVTSVVTAGYARGYEQENNVILRDNVLIVNTKGEQLSTNELIWNQQISKFFTEKPVKIVTNSEVTYGDGLEANQDFSWYQIKHLRGTMQVSKTEVPQ